MTYEIGPDWSKLERLVHVPVYGRRDMVETVFPGLVNRPSLWSSIVQSQGLAAGLVAPSRFVHRLQKVSPAQFEVLSGKLLAKLGLERVSSSGGIADGGKDGMGWTPDGHRVAYQCKRWATPVGVATVHELQGTMNDESCDYGVLLTTGRYTSGAEKSVSNLPIILIEGLQLADMLLWVASAEGARMPSSDASLKEFSNALNALFSRFDEVVTELSTGG